MLLAGSLWLCNGTFRGNINKCKIAAFFIMAFVISAIDIFVVVIMAIEIQRLREPIDYEAITKFSHGFDLSLYWRRRVTAVYALIGVIMIAAPVQGKMV